MTDVLANRSQVDNQLHRHDATFTPLVQLVASCRQRHPHLLNTHS